MNFRKQIVAVFTISFVFIFFLTILASNQVFSLGRVKAKSYTADIFLSEHGDMTIKEQLVMKYPSGYSVIFRDIIYDKNINSKNPVTDDQAYFDTSSVKVRVKNSNNQYIYDVDQGINQGVRVGYSFLGHVDEYGEPIGCPTNIKTAQCESIFIQVLNGMDEQMTFEYEYTIRGAVTKYNDIAVLNWRILEYFPNRIDKAYITINLPTNSHSKNDFHIFGHGLYSGTTDIKSNQQVVLDINKIRKGDFIEFRLLMPLDVMPNVRPINQVKLNQYQLILDEEAELARKANLLRTTYWILLLAGVAIMLGAIGLIIYIYKKYDKEFIPSFDGKYYRELPADYSPAEMSYLYYFKKTHDEDITATILDLIRRKYLVLENAEKDINAKKPDFVLKLNKDKDLQDLKAHENHLITWFIYQIGDGEKVSLKQIENYPKDDYKKAKEFNDQAKKFVEKVSIEGNKHDFFDKTIEKARPKLYGFILIPIIYIFFAFFAGVVTELNPLLFIIIGIIIIIVYSLYVASVKRRSKNGNNDYAKWKAFRTFLLEFSQIKDYPIPGIVVWEHYLVYATSLKIADKVMEQLKVKLPINEYEATQATYLGFGYYYPNFYYGYAFGRINSSLSTARRNSFQTISTHTASKFSSGIGRGGGFSGGSSFGGGGGGFRTR